MSSDVGWGRCSILIDGVLTIILYFATVYLGNLSSSFRTCTQENFTGSSITDPTRSCRKSITKLPLGARQRPRSVPLTPQRAPSSSWSRVITDTRSGTSFKNISFTYHILLMTKFLGRQELMLVVVSTISFSHSHTCTKTSYKGCMSLGENVKK